MAGVQMNVRMDEALKERGDRVLKELGVSASDAVRALWTYIADRGELPPMETSDEEAAREAERRRRMKAVEESAGMVRRAMVDAGILGEDEDPLGGMTYRQLRDGMYEDKLDDYLDAAEGNAR